MAVRRFEDNLVSVIMPAYNTEKYIQASIESVIQQKYTNWELIVVDDKSPDSCISIINKYRKQDVRIKLVRHNQNRGLLEARNTGLEIARGRFVAFLDSDDIWLPNKLETQLSFMLDVKSAFTFTSYGFINNLGERHDNTHYVKGSYDYNRALLGNDIGVLTVILDRYKLGDVKFQFDREILWDDGRKCYLPMQEDYALWLTLFKQGIVADALSDITCLYREHSGQMTSNKFICARAIWRIYRRKENLSLLRSMYCLLFYTIKGMRKHLRW